MSLLEAQGGSARIAVVGAVSPAGAELRQALADARVPGDRVELYGPSPDEAEETVISEYDGEARLIQEPDLDSILRRDVVFLCEPSPAATDVARRATGPTVVIDLARCGVLDPDARTVHLDIDPEGVEPSARYIPVAHHLSLLLSEVLHPLEQRLGIEEVVGVILRPASDFGERGVVELREQVVRLLNFGEVPVSTFGRQLAFNILSQAQVGDRDVALEQRIAREVGQILGWARPRLALQLVTAPIFYGHCVQLRVRLGNGAVVGDVAQALAESRFAGPPEEVAATPLELATERRVSISPPSEDGLGGFWIWATAGEAGGRGAIQAVRIARAVADL